MNHQFNTLVRPEFLSNGSDYFPQYKHIILTDEQKNKLLEFIEHFRKWRGTDEIYNDKPMPNHEPRYDDLPTYWNEDSLRFVLEQMTEKDFEFMSEFFDQGSPAGSPGGSGEDTEEVPALSLPATTYRTFNSMLPGPEFGARFSLSYLVYRRI